MCPLRMLKGIFVGPYIAHNHCKTECDILCKIIEHSSLVAIKSLRRAANWYRSRTVPGWLALYISSLSHLLVLGSLLLLLQRIHRLPVFQGKIWTKYCQLSSIALRELP